jgi:hypothetical protein
MPSRWATARGPTITRLRACTVYTPAAGGSASSAQRSADVHIIKRKGPPPSG